MDALLIALLLAQLMVVSEELGWRWINHPWLTQIGVWSYSLYLYHAWGWIFGDSLNAQPAAAVLLGTAGSFVLSHRIGTSNVLRSRYASDWNSAGGRPIKRRPSQKTVAWTGSSSPPELIPPSGSNVTRIRACTRGFAEREH
jgi:hypothetical protein